MLALVDLDGTLADFAGEMTRCANLLRSPNESTYADTGHDTDDPPYLRERKRLIKNRPGFWKSLNRIPTGFEIVSVLEECGYDIHILTKGPANNPNAWAEKLEWVRSQTEIAKKPITITSDKGIVYGKILVDDWPPYIDAWLAHRPRGLLIMPAQPWNENYKSDTGRLYRYTGNKEELKQLIKNFQKWSDDRTKPFIFSK